MDSDSLVLYGVLALAAVSVAVIVYIIAYPFLSGERATEKRIEGLTKEKSTRTARSGNSVDDVLNKKKQVQENLKELERRQKAKNKVTMRTRLMRAGLDVTPRSFHMASAIAGIVLGTVAYVLGASGLVAALLAFVGALGLPRWFLSYLIKRRQGRFVGEFANAIDVIVRGVKTGLPLNECLEIIARESPEPIRTEFGELLEQQRVGVPLGECFDRMMMRVPLPEVNFFAIVIAIQQSAGGNLAEALGNLSGVLRARRQLAAKVQALSGEAKASAAILAALPFAVMGMVYATSPEYISLLWEEKMGQMMMGLGGFWMSCGILVMRKMINFKY